MDRRAFMRWTGMGLAAAAVAAYAGSVPAGAAAGRADGHPRQNPAPAGTPGGRRFDPALPAVPPATTVPLRLSIEAARVETRPGAGFHAWTYEGTVPGPTIRVKQGDRVQFTLANHADRPHSIDFHAAQINPQRAYRPLAPGEELRFDWTAHFPGVFLYHCGVDMVRHIGRGMFGVVVVDPAGGRPPAREYVIVQAEVDGSVVFNGMANRHVHEPLPAAPGEAIRLYVANAGPNRFSAFHVVGAVFARVQPDGNPENLLKGVQTYTLGPGAAAVFELSIPEPGDYPFVTHALADAEDGAAGIIRVG